jgi:uncharacterized tellurite resistance protein B-like protein
MAWFEGKDAKQRKSALVTVLRVMLADGKIDAREQVFLAKVAGRLGIKEKEFKKVLANPSAVEFHPPKDDKERICQLFDVILMMLADGRVDQREMELCIHAASRLGFRTSTVPTLVNGIVQKINQGAAREQVATEFANIL